MAASLCGHLGAVALSLAWWPAPTVVTSPARSDTVTVQLMLYPPEQIGQNTADNRPNPLHPSEQRTEQPRTDFPSSGVEYLPASRLGSAPVPKSAPAIEQLAGTVFTGLPIQLRLLIDAHGRVRHIETLQASSDDELAVERIKAMLYATAYIPGRQNGAPVAAQLDLELNLTQ